MTESANAQNPSGFGLVSKTRAKKRLWVWRFLIFILPLLVIAGSIGAFAAMSALKPTPEEKEDVIKAIPVLTAVPVQEDVTLSVNVQGEAQARTQINIVPQVSGLITYMSPKFIEGGRFKKGDLLIRIDPAEFELRIVQARANVAQAETVISRETSESQMARRDWEELGREGQPSALTLRQPQMAEARAQLESAKARLAEAELQLSRTEIYAPFNGRVITRRVDQGEFVTTGTRLGEVYATNVVDVRLPMTNEDLRRAGLTLDYNASESAASHGSRGVPVTLTADIAGIFSEWQGRIIRTDSRFDSQTRVLFAYAEVKDPFGSGASNGTPLAPGVYVNAQITGQTLSNIIKVPRTALRGKDKVYVATADNKLSIKTVTVLSSDRESAILDGGITRDMRVITSPIRGAAEGMKIETVSSSASAASDTPSGDAP